MKYALDSTNDSSGRIKLKHMQFVGLSDTQEQRREQGGL